MNVMIEDAGPCKKILKFEVPKETIEDEFEKKTKEACNVVSIPGFRKGRAPRKLVEKRFGSQIKDDVLQTVVGENYQKALEEHKINPVGEPAFGDINLEVGKPLNFDVTLEVWPTFEIDDYKGLKLKRNISTEITEEEMEKALADIALKRAQISEVKKGKVQKGDYVICDCKVEVNGKEVLDDDNIEVYVAENAKIVNTAVPDLVEKLEGSKSGSVTKIDVKLSDDFTIEEYRGKEATLKLVVNEIKRSIPPEINDEFAKTVGVESLDDLKNNVRKQLEIYKKNQTEDDFRNQILDSLLSKVDIELPQDFVKAHTNQRVYKHQVDLLQRGMPLEEIEKKIDVIKNASADSVMRELKASLILDHIAKKEKIFVTENEVEQRIENIARLYNTDVKKVRKQLEDQGNLSNLRNEMRESKTVDFLLKEAQIEE